MAENEENRQDVVVCPICVETFRKPVVLPCQHSFCRECVGLYADKCKSGQKGVAACTAESDGVDQVIQCPICRAPTDLGKEGVSGLPLNFELEEMVRRIASDVKVEENVPCCHVCEEDNQARGVKYCTNCCVMYCKDCLASCHPMKGALKRHCLISAQEYMSQETSESQLQTGTQTDGDLTCERHGQPLVIYCVTCEAVFCVGCLGEHPLHTTRDVKSAAEEHKAQVITMSDHLEKIKQEVKQILSKFMDLDHNIQANQKLHLEDIEKAYSAALGVLTTWRNDSIVEVTRRNTKWSGQSAAAVKHLEMELEEVGMAQKSSQDLLASVNVKILKGSKELLRSIDDQLTETQISMEQHEEMRQLLLESVNNYPVQPRRVIVREADSEQRIVRRPNITKPELKFTETNDDRLSIILDGTVVECGDLFEGYWCTARTDGRFQTGRYYWELDITFIPCSSATECFCCVGVEQESDRERGDNPSRQDYEIWIKYSRDGIHYYTPCGGAKTGPYTEHHRLGVYLDCFDRSLIIVDCVNNQLMYSVSDINLSAPLVPYVAFDYAHCASARLVKANGASLPQIVWYEQLALRQKAGRVERRMRKIYPFTISV